jgi:hypothetical protein
MESLDAAPAATFVTTAYLGYFNDLPYHRQAG